MVYNFISIKKLLFKKERKEKGRKGGWPGRRGILGGGWGVETRTPEIGWGKNNHHNSSYSRI